MVEKLGIDAYALISQEVVDASDIDPAALGKLRHIETCDLIGDVTAWVHALERRRQEDVAASAPTPYVKAPRPGGRRGWAP